MSDRPRGRKRGYRRLSHPLRYAHPLYILSAAAGCFGLHHPPAPTPAALQPARIHTHSPTLPPAPCTPQVVFCCLARRVNLEVAQTLYNMGIPFAWVHNQLITCSYLCGLRGSSTSSSMAQMEEKLRMGVERIQETTGGLSNQRARKRHVQVGV